MGMIGGAVDEYFIGLERTLRKIGKKDLQLT